VIRTTIIRVLLFALPFGLYALYLLLQGPDRTGAPRQHPWTPLVIAGLVLVASSFLIWGLTEGEPVGLYVAPHLEHGKVVPGHVEKGP
jgi:hypothetical protein